MILYCVRHGESSYNAEGRIQGQSDVPLSDMGRCQAERVAEALAKHPLDAIFASPLERAHATAREVAERTGVEIIVEDGLKEIHAGIFQGLKWDEIHHSYPEEAARWIAQEPDFVIPQGESRRALMNRGVAAFDKIRASGYNCVAVIAHGGLLTATLKGLLRIPAELNPFSLYNASISMLRWHEQVTVLTLNEVEHLRAAEGDLLGSLGDL